MDQASWPSVVRMLIVGLFGIAGGSALTLKLAGVDAAVAFGRLGGIWLAVGFAGALLLLKQSKKNIHAYLYLCALNINIGCTSLLLGISIPLFIRYDLTTWVGRFLALYCALLLIHQIWRFHKHFISRWNRNKDKAFSKAYDPVKRTIFIDDFIHHLNVEANLILPIRSTLVRDLFYVALLFSMLVGLNFRKLFPEASALAWGIPSFTAFPALVMISLLRIEVAIKIKSFERATGQKMIPADRFAK
jgi:hypothetical protein